MYYKERKHRSFKAFSVTLKVTIVTKLLAPVVTFKQHHDATT